MSSPTDGTDLNLATIPGGSEIDDEVITSGSGLATVAGKVPRSKITLGDRNVDDGDVSAGNPLPVTGEFAETAATTGALSSVAASVTSVTLLAVNSARLGATITNDSTSVLYVALASSASSTAFTVQLNPGDYYELPARYVGAISGLWVSATGAARLGELT